MNVVLIVIPGPYRIKDKIIVQTLDNETCYVKTTIPTKHNVQIVSTMNRQFCQALSQIIDTHNELGMHLTVEVKQHHKMYLKQFGHVS